MFPRWFPVFCFSCYFGMGGGLEGKEAYSSSRVPNPRTQHIHTRSKDIHQRAIVGEPRADIKLIARTDSARRRLRRRRVVRRIVIAIPRRNSKEHPRLDHRRRGVVDGRGARPAQRHVGDGAVGAAARGRVGRDKVHAGDDAGRGAGAVGVEDLDGVQLGLLGDAVVDAANGAGYVGAVAVAVGGLAVAGEVGEPGGAALELLG